MRAIILDPLMAVLGALLPVWWWDRFPALQIRRAAAASAMMTLAVGLAVGITGFFSFSEAVASRANDLLLRGAGDSTAGPVAVMIASPLMYAVGTPRGIASLYLVLSSVVRLLTLVGDDPWGDPIVTIAAGAVTRASAARRHRAQASARERREGPEVADRRYPGEWAGLPQADFVIVASRRKPGWDAGVFVITPGQWYRLGAPFDLETREGLRAVYPITALTTVEVLRKGVEYELPPLSRVHVP